MAIIGSGIPALHLAKRLTDESIDTVILSPTPGLCEAWSGKGIDIAGLGFRDSPNRLIESIGFLKTNQLLEYAFDGTRILKEANCIEGDTILLAANEQEATDLEASLMALDKMNQPSSWLSKEECEFSIGHFQGGLIINNAGTANGHAYAQHCYVKAKQKGLRVFLGTPQTEPIDVGDKLKIVCQSGHGKCDVVVFANGSRASALDPFLKHAIHPIRHQFMAIPKQTSARIASGKAQFGHYRFQDMNGVRIVSGCRWASAHLETGETNAHKLNPLVSAALLKSTQQRFPREHPLKIQKEWAAVGAGTCDGLPLIGPLPGRQDILVCSGFGEEETSLGLRGAESIARLLIEGKDDQLPFFFTPRRLLQ